MGIYASGNIFGIKIYSSDQDDNIVVLFTQIYDTVMDHEQMKEAYVFYTNELKNKNNIFFKIYTECSSTLDHMNKCNIMMWYPMSLDTFLEKFNT